MKTITLLLIVYLFLASQSYAQSFQGTLEYKVEFEYNEENLGLLGLTKQDMLDKLNKDSDYCENITVKIKKGNYLVKDDSNLQKSLIYHAGSNTIYSIETGQYYITLINAIKHNSVDAASEIPKVVYTNDTKIIMGERCKLLKLVWEDSGEELYWFNNQLIPINPKLFSKHNHDYLNLVFNKTRSYPAEISKKLNSLVTFKMTLVAMKDEKIEDTTFDIPKLMEPYDKRFEAYEESSGNKVMLIYREGMEINNPVKE